QMEDEILDCMAQIEERTAQLPELDKAVQQAKAEFQEYQKNAESRVADLQAQLERTMQEVEQIQVQLPDKAKSELSRLIAGRGEDAMAPVHNRTCMACDTEITAQALNDL